MVQPQQKATTQFSSLIEKLHHFDHVLSSRRNVLPSTKEEFQKFLLSLDAPTKDNFVQFDFLNSRVNEFLGAHLKDKTALWTICTLIFFFSHSQCAVEWEFCINKEIKSIVYQRVVYDYLEASKVDLHNYPISSCLLKSCKSARQKYSMRNIL